MIWKKEKRIWEKQLSVLGYNIYPAIVLFFFFKAALLYTWE